MKRKQESADKDLEEIFRLIEEKKFEEAKKLIPPQSRHLVLSHNTMPLLHFAVKNGCVDIVNYLLDGGADIELGRGWVRTICLLCLFFGEK